MRGETRHPPLPQGTFAEAMKTHLQMTKQRVQGLYVRPRALFAESIVAALVDGTVVEFPAAAWDVEMLLPPRGTPIRIQVKCSGERAPPSPEKTRPADWGNLKAPMSAKDPAFLPLKPGFNCDVFVFARHEGTDIERGWRFYVLSKRRSSAERRGGTPGSTVSGSSGLAPFIVSRRTSREASLRSPGRDDPAG